MRRYIYLSILIILFSLISLLITVPSTDDFSLYNPLWNGISTLHDEYGFKYVHLSDLKSIPSNCLVFIFPSRPIDESQTEVLEAFLKRGGTLILLDEYGYSNGFLHSIGSEIKVTSSLLRDPLYKWRSSEFPCAWINFEGKIFKIYLNYASTLYAGKAKVLGVSSYFSFSDKDLDGSHDAGEPSGKMCVAASYRFGKGLLIIFSDSSIFLNSMLNLGENKLLLENLIRDREPYVLKDTLSFGAYTLLRENIVSTCTAAYNLMFYSSISYLLMFLTAISVFSAARALYFRLQKRYMSVSLKDTLYDVLRLHPSWDRKVLEKLLPEVFEDFEHNRKD